MRETSQDWSERLIAAEPIEPDRMETLRQEINAVLEKRFSKSHRLFLLVGGIFLMILAGGGMVAIALDGRPQPSFIRAIAFGSAALCLVLGVLNIWFAWTGVFHRQKHNNVFVLLAVLILGALGIVFLNLGWRGNDGQLVFTGQLMLAILGFSLILHFAEQWNLSLKQKLLELEFRLAEISEKLDRDRR